MTDAPAQHEPEVVEDFDAFWQAHTSTERTVHVNVYGVLVPRPVDVSLALSRRIEQISENTGEAELSDSIEQLFGVDGLYERLVEEAKLTPRQLVVLLFWGMLNAQGQRVSLADAAAKVAEAEAAAGESGSGEGNGPNREARRAQASGSRKKSGNAGARSSRTSGANTGSPQTT